MSSERGHMGGAERVLIVSRVGCIRVNLELVESCEVRGVEMQSKLDVGKLVYETLRGMEF